MGVLTNEGEEKIPAYVYEFQFEEHLIVDFLEEVSGQVDGSHLSKRAESASADVCDCIV